jgi:PAS domain S-box-containing protein
MPAFNAAHRVRLLPEFSPGQSTTWTSMIRCRDRTIGACADPAREPAARASDADGEGTLVSPMDPIPSELALLRAALDTLPDGLMLLRAVRDGADAIVDFEWIYANRSSAALLGHEPHALPGRRLLALVPRSRADGSFERYVRVVETGAPAVLDVSCDHSSRSAWVFHRCTKVGDGVVVVVCREQRPFTPSDRDPWSFTRDLFMQAPFAISVLQGAEHQFLIANPHFERMVGRRDLAGKGTAEVFPEVGADSAVRRMLDLVRTSGEPFTASEFPVRLDIDGHVDDRYFQFTCSPVREGDAVVAIQAVAVDVTAQVRSRRQAEEMAERLEENERRFRATFENAAVGIAHVSPSGQWLRFNERMRSILGYPREELARLRFQDVTHPDDLERDVSLAEAVLRGEIESYQLEKRYIRKDGGVVWANLTVSLVRGENGVPLFFVSVVEDIAERKVAEAALREADRQKDEFLAMLSHELRNPLAVVRSATELLETVETSDLMIPRIQTVLLRQTSHMARLLDDLLDLARIASGKLVIEPAMLDLREVVREVLSDLEPMLRQRARLAVELPPTAMWVDGDRVRLAQVVHNLVSNALKYTPPQGAVGLRLHTARGGAVITVTDTGIGLDPELRPHLFKPFRQGPQDIARSAGGLGLGLAVSKTIVELHRGTIEARSAGRDRGSEFEVWLPLAHVDDDVVHPAEPAPHARAVRFLVVEDNEDGAELLAALLRARGHDVEISMRGQDALQLLERWIPDVVICDIGLPDIDGYEVARAIRSDPRLASVELVALSGYGQVEDRRRSAQAGFHVHFTKPADVDAILEAILSKAQPSRS